MRPRKAGAARASAARAGDSPSLGLKGQRWPSGPVRSWSSVIWSSNCSLGLPPPLELPCGVLGTFWPFTSQLGPVSPVGCSSPGAFCLGGTLVLPSFAPKLIYPFFLPFTLFFEVSHHYSHQQERCFEAIFSNFPS